MEDSVSPNSSRESSPGYENGYHGSRRCSSSNSIAELSRHFNQHSLTPRRPSTALKESTPRARDPNPYLQSPNSSSNRVCRRRQSINRLQCSSAHLSRISTLVEDMVQTGQPYNIYDPTHSSSMLDDSTSPSLSPDEHASSSSSSSSSFSSSYFGFTPLSASSAVGGSNAAQLSLRHQHSYRIDKDLRHSASRDGLGKPMVKKKIRMRRSSKSLSNGMGKRCDR
ncbi:hypothetical protein OEA41_006505 [Lepraria neglecta]|uniref:Uncharacterized protein n=1 Tax=Lepraria neglecta TaxID=209136 RepID=A0AAD9Z7Y5_9LECA|nr:hypothetical protein OEA41_006505 [Lepraria neglecta]